MFQTSHELRHHSLASLLPAPSNLSSGSHLHSNAVSILTQVHLLVVSLETASMRFQNQLCLAWDLCLRIMLSLIHICVASLRFSQS